MTPTDTEDELASLLDEAGVEPPLAQRLAIYGSLLLGANQRVNLTGARNGRELLPHLLDSLTLVPYLGDAQTLVDIGSGGGLPGIPIALASTVRPTLIEAVAKKAAFLRVALEALHVDGKALAVRAELAARDVELRERFDLATARAVSGASTVAELTLPFVRVGGRVLLQRGAMEQRERQALDDAVAVLGAHVEREITFGESLRLIIVIKVAAIGERFPRRNGVPEKRPLCY